MNKARWGFGVVHQREAALETGLRVLTPKSLLTFYKAQKTYVSLLTLPLTIGPFHLH